MNQSELPIGVFDSGVGGLTVVDQLCRALPHEDVIYLGDTARVPYGTKSPATVARFGVEDTHFLMQQNVKAVVVACNTASAWALPAIEKDFSGLPLFGVILPGARAALQASRNRRIGVIGTSATVRSQAYERAIAAQDTEARVFARACPLLVPLVEEGRVTGQITRLVLRDYLAPLLREKIDTLVLGCTHYPLLKETIRSVVGKKVALIDSAESCATDVRQRLADLGLLARKRRRAGTIQPFVTDDVARFDELAQRFLGRKTEQAWRVDLAS